MRKVTFAHVTAVSANTEWCCRFHFQTENSIGMMHDRRTASATRLRKVILRKLGKHLMLVFFLNYVSQPALR